MASVFDYLAQGQPSEADYLSDNPFYMGGRGIGQIQIQPTTNSEAWWMPAVQGGLSGLLQGVGRSQARQSQFADTREMPFIKAALADETALKTNPSLAAYLSETAPESWSPKQAKADVLTSILMAQNLEEQKAKKAEIAAALQAKIAEANNPDIIAGEAARAGAIEKAKAENTPAKPKEIPSALLGELADQKGIVDEARALGSTLVQSKDSWAKLRGAEMFSGLDENGISSRIADLADRVLRSRTGTAAPIAEQNTLRKIIAGDKTVSPQQAGNLILKFAEREAANAKSKADLALSGNVAEAFAGAPVPTGEVTKSGKKVYIVNGVKGTID